MWTNIEVEQINAAFAAGIAAVNQNAKQPFLANKSNFTTLVQYMMAESVDRAGYFYPQVWQSAVISVADQLEKEPPKMTQEEIAYERELNDRAAGRQLRPDSSGYDLAEQIRNTVKRQSQAANNILKRDEERRHREANPFIPGPDATEADFRKMTASEIKTWTQKYAPRNKNGGYQLKVKKDENS